MRVWLTGVMQCNVNHQDKKTRISTRTDFFFFKPNRGGIECLDVYNMYLPDFDLDIIVVVVVLLIQFPVFVIMHGIASIITVVLTAEPNLSFILR